jgi:hypothetical protein
VKLNLQNKLASPNEPPEDRPKLSQEEADSRLRMLVLLQKLKDQHKLLELHEKLLLERLGQSPERN